MKKPHRPRFPGLRCSEYSLLLLTFVSSAYAADPINYFVNANSGDNANNDCLTIATPCKTIAYALSKASSGYDLINIAAGTYTEGASITRDVNLIGENARTTIIDPGKTWSTGITVSNDAAVVISNLTVANTSGNGIYSSGASTDLRLENVRLLQHDNYGLFIDGGAARLKKVEISENGQQGIHLNPGATNIYIANTTISANGTVGNSNSAGIGSASGSTTQIINSSIYANERAGVSSYSTISFTNTIVAGHAYQNCAGGGTLSSLGNNLSDDNTCNFDQASDQNDTVPKLVALAFNGGTTRSHALLANSPAIDTGSNIQCTDEDQRGQTRPVDGDEDGQATCDIGAYEATVSINFLPIKNKSGKIMVIPF